jgi:hypothetical protein
VTTLTQVAQTWSDLYSGSPVLRTTIGFSHLGALLVGGGCAVGDDLATLRASDLAHLPKHRKGVHRTVVAGLAILIVSGALLFFANLDTYLYSKAFWIKMGLVLALFANGLAIVRAERVWNETHIRRVARISLALWILTTFAGVVLMNS